MLGIYSGTVRIGYAADDSRVRAQSSGTGGMVMRKAAGLTQLELARRAGVGLRFVRELEQGKQTVRLDKVHQVLALFGCGLRVVRRS